MPDQLLVERVASTLGTEPGLVEKDWQIVRAIGVLAELDHGDARPAFSGGTSLSIAWGIIKRFSEDIDFKIALPAGINPSRARAQRRAYRKKIFEALGSADFDLVGNPLVGNESKFFAANFGYRSDFAVAAGLRPHLRIEMTFQTPSLLPIPRPIQSLASRAQKQSPEIAAFSCVDPVETAADKLSALAWRVCARDRSAADDDPTIVRHIHDLAAIESRVSSATVLKTLFWEVMKADTGRGGSQVPIDPEERLVQMIERLTTDPLWSVEYAKFVHDVSFAPPDESISFAGALEGVKRLVKICKSSSRA